MVYDKDEIGQRSDRLYKYTQCQKMKLNYHVQFDRLQFMMKTRQDKDMTNCTGTVYAKIEFELS